MLESGGYEKNSKIYTLISTHLTDDHCMQLLEKRHLTDRNLLRRYHVYIEKIISENDRLFVSFSL